MHRRFKRVYSETQTGASRITARNRSGVRKHTTISYRPRVGDEMVKCFGKVVRMLVSPTRDDIKNYLEMRLGGDIDPNVMDDELGADIMKVIPEMVSEIEAIISSTFPIQV